MDLLGDGVDAVGSAGEIRRGELHGPAVLVAEFGDLVGVGGDEDAVELRAGACSLEDPGEHGPAGEAAEDLAREASGGQACGDDSKDDGRLLFGLGGIKYDWRWLCRGECLSFAEFAEDVASRCFVSALSHTHFGGVAQMVRATDS